MNEKLLEPITPVIEPPPAFLKEALQSNETLPAEATSEKEEVYYATNGTVKNPRRSFWQRFRRPPARPPYWRCIYETPEEAETDASRPSEIWQWDGHPPYATTLAEIMSEARQDGDLGVVLRRYDHDKKTWYAARRWPADVPLR